MAKLGQPCLLAWVLLLASWVQLSGADSLARALELQRRGNCKEALPILHKLQDGEPRNPTYARLIERCAPNPGAPALTLNEARAGARRPTAEEPTAKGRKAPPPIAPDRSPVKVAKAVLKGENPQRLLQGAGPTLREEAEPSSTPRPIAGKRTKPASPKPTPATAFEEPAPPAAFVPPPPDIPAASAPPPSAEAREREAAGQTFASAERLIKAKKYDEAQKLLEPLVEAKPSLVLPRLRLAEIYSAKKLFPEAARHYGILAGREEQGDFRLREALNYSWGKRYADSAMSFEQYLKTHSKDAEAQLGLAQVLFWSDRLAESAEAYRRYLELKPEDAHARLNYGRALLWSGKSEEAYSAFSEAKKQLPPDIMVDLLIAKSLEQTKHPERALAVYDLALAADPNNKDAIEGRERVTGLVLLQAGYSKQEKNDFQGAIDAFTSYLKKFPADEKLQLQVGRLHAWSKQPADAVPYYAAYLNKQPEDLVARRELARIQISMPEFASARETYATIVNSGKAQVEDYEGLVNSHIWDGQLDSARPFVERLLQLDPQNPIGKKALATVNDTKRRQDLEAAQRLASARKYKEAIAAYRQFATEHGATWDVELATARLYGWNKQAPKAVQAYHEYLSRYPRDLTARLELAELERWSGRYQAAETEYQQVLKAQPNNTQALFGKTSIADSRGDDRFEVYGAYRELLAREPGHQVARQRLSEIVPAVSPSLKVSTNNFHDSDDFGRQISTAEVGIPFRGGLKLSPMVRHGYFRQFREVGGGYCGTGQAASSNASESVLAVSQSVCAANGSVSSLGGGVRFELMPNRAFSLTGEVAAMRLDAMSQRTSLNASAELAYSPKPLSTLMLSLVRRDAVFDVNTVGSLFAGIQQTGVLLSYQQPLSDRWRLWGSGGVARYGGGTAGLFNNNLQRRAAARIDYQVLPWMTAGYFLRVSGFTSQSPLYFSPRFYGTTGLRYFWEKPMTRGLRSIGEMEFGYGRINQFNAANVNVAEFSLNAGIAWDIRPDLTLRLGYRFGRGRSSSFGSPVYSTGILDFGMSNFWTPAMPAVNPNRIEIR